MSVELKKSSVVFRSEDHTYWLGEKQLQGITGTLIKRAFPDKYKDVAPAVLANAARRGTAVHEAIAFADRFGDDGMDNVRVRNYMRLKAERGLETVENEYLVSDEERYASSIDLVMTDKAGDIVLVDTKTTYNLDRDSVALQLSIYRRFFEQQNPGLKVAHIYALWLPNKDENICQLVELQPWADEVIDSLMEADAEDKAFDITTTYGDLPARFGEVEEEVARLQLALKAAQERMKELQTGLYDLMEKKGVKSFTGSRVRLTRVLPTKASTFDSKTFKKDHPDLYQQYVKESQRAGSLKITLI